MDKLEKELLYLGWFLLFFTTILNISFLVCYHQDREKLRKENEYLNSLVKDYDWQLKQLYYINEKIKKGDEENEYR